MFKNSRLIRRFMDIYIYILYIYIVPMCPLGPSGPLSMSSCHQGLLCQSLPSQGIQKIPAPETTCTLESIEYWRFGYTGVSSATKGVFYVASLQQQWLVDDNRNLPRLSSFQRMPFRLPRCVCPPQTKHYRWSKFASKYAEVISRSVWYPWKIPIQGSAIATNLISWKCFQSNQNYLWVKTKLFLKQGWTLLTPPSNLVVMPCRQNSWMCRKCRCS